MLGKKISNLVLNLEKEQEKIEDKYAKEIIDSVKGKSFRINDTICCPNKNYEQGDIIKISGIYFYDGHEIGFKNELNEEFDVFDIEEVEFIDDCK